jgi:hypothetical protein
MLVETPWRVERESDGWRLSHADEAAETSRVFALGPSQTAEEALRLLTGRK